ncbi:hypothetical protein NQ317_000806 [Molorchus minor]|uniref:Uncharacterized protein n=1 Tax=Molorchus minor TaxID=1323400 RepID=A0ABQ9J3R5_9CUCU|nr:hypothetical protein NQ317_000806 [Molorchus minor]
MASMIFFSPDSELEYALKEAWKPFRQNELHPVICNPTDGDSDEYLLPIVLADLHYCNFLNALYLDNETS